MKSNPLGAEFVAGPTDDPFGLNTGWHISSRYDECTFGNFMSLRAAALTEFGIHGIWKKWENMRRVFNVTHRAEQYFVALSFDNSDIHLQFCLYGVCALLSMLAAVAEIIHYRVKRTFSALC